MLVTSLKRLLSVTVAVVPAALMATAGEAVAQLDVTPNVSEQPTETTPWIIQMAVGAGILGVVILLALAAGYLRFAPKFFGREEATPARPPGYRPPLLARGTGQSGRAPAGATRPAAGSAPAAAATSAPAAPAATATATAEAPARAPSEEEQIAAPDTEGEAAAAEATERPTAGPESEPAVQADAVGEAEAAAPEPRPSAKTTEEVAASPEEAPPEAAAEPAEAAEPEAAEPEAAEPEAAEPEAAEAEPEAAEPEAAEPEAGPAASSAPGGAAMDQETFDRVLEEQLGKGVDRRVAEGRARAAAVVAARKRAQG